jgi:hypothetical protein
MWLFLALFLSFRSNAEESADAFFAFIGSHPSSAVMMTCSCRHVFRLA